MDLKKEIKLSDLVPKGVSLKRKPAVKEVRRRPLPKEIVGLKIESASLTAAQVVNDTERSVVKLARAPLASGVVNGGEVRDPVALGIALAEFFAANKLPRRGVRLGLGNSRIGVRIVEVPAIEDQAQLENAIRYRAHEILSASLDDAVIDYHLLGTRVDENGETLQSILLVVAYRESIDRYLAATDAAQIDVVGIDLEAFALLRATSMPQPEGEKLERALVVVSVDHERTTLAISDGVVCHFTRVLEWGDANIDNAVARGLKITSAEAAELRRDAGSDKAAAVREIVAHELQTLVRELQSSLRFYQAQPKALQIGMVLLSGVLADLDGFADELRGQLGMELVVADPFTRVRIDDSVERPERPSELAVAIGLGIED